MESNHRTNHTVVVAGLPPVLALIALGAAALAADETVIGTAGVAIGLVTAAALALLARRAPDQGRVERPALIAVAEATERLARTTVPGLLTQGSNARISAGTDGDAEAPIRPSADCPEPNDPTIRRLVTALDAVHDATDAEAAHLRTERKDAFRTLLVDLVRRHQRLLDLQLDAIDALHAEAPDARARSRLHDLDHLATRMRRDAESLFVLADVESNRERSGAVSAPDLMRVAAAEIEAYERVNTGDLDDVSVVGPAVVDVAHMLAELLENATRFSPPDSAVTVTGRTTDDGTYRVTITDTGLGLPGDEYAAANEVLAGDPELDIPLPRTIGLSVVARLATRLGASVRLAPTDGRGTTADITIPAALVVPTTPLGHLPNPTEATVDAPVDVMADEEPEPAPTLADALGTPLRLDALLDEAVS